MSRSLPALRNLYERYADRRDRFEVIAVHDTRAKTFQELDQHLAPIIAGPWEGKPLPFPILLDATGKTIEAYGIRQFPTFVLIDPDGRVVPRATIETFEAALRTLPPPR